MSTQVNELMKTVLMWVLSALSGLLFLLWSELKSDVKELEKQQIQIMAERFTPEDAEAMENRLSKAVEASIVENRNGLASLRSEMNDKLDTIIHFIRKGG